MESKEFEYIKQKIKELENHYIFCWNNKEKMEITRGRFNSFVYSVVENTRAEIIKLLEDEKGVI